MNDDSKGSSGRNGTERETTKLPTELGDELLRQCITYDDSRLLGISECRGLEYESPELAHIVRLLHDTFASLQPPLAGVVAADAVALPNPFGRFEILEEIGQGSFGTVWRARDPLLGRHVAIKVPLAALRLDQELSIRFLREAKAVSRLNHPNIVRVYEAGEISGIPYMASEYVAGPTLSELLALENSFPPEVAARIVGSLADAVEHAHLQGVTHRDIKPGNVLVDTGSDGVVIPRLADFGLAQFTGDGEKSCSGLLIGTPTYMAPELLLRTSLSYGPVTDVYSLGVVLYELLTGKLPNTGVSPKLATEKNSIRLSSTRLGKSSIPRDLLAICQQCTSYEPTQRYQSAGELRADLARFHDGRPTLARPRQPVEVIWNLIANHREASASFAIVLLSLMAVIAVVWNSKTSAESQKRVLSNAVKVGEKLEKRAEENEAYFREVLWMNGMETAYRSFNESNLTATRRALDAVALSRADGDSRPEWVLLDSELKTRFRVLRSVPYPLREIVTVDEGSTIAFAGDDASVSLFQLNTGNVVTTFESNIPTIHALSASRDGRMLAVGGSARNEGKTSPIIIDLESQLIRRSSLEGEAVIESLAFSPNGKTLASAFRYEGTELIPTDDLSATRSMMLLGSRRNKSLAWTFDGGLLVQQAEGILQHVTEEGRHLGTITRSEGFEVFDSHPAQPWLAAMASQNTVEIIDYTNSETLLTLTGATDRCSSIKYSSDGQWLAAGQNDGQIVVWQFPQDLSAIEGHSLTCAVKNQIHEGGIPGIVWDRATILSIGEDGRLIRFAPQVDAIADLRSCDITAVCFEVSPNRVLLGYRTGEVLSVETQRLLTQTDYSVPQIGQLESTKPVLGASGIEVSALSQSSDSKLIAVAFANGALKVLGTSYSEIISLPSPEATEPTKAHRINNVCFIPDRNLVVWTGSDKLVHGKDLENGLDVLNLKMYSACEHLAVSPDSGLIGVCGVFEGIRLIDLASVLQIDTLGTNSVASFNFSSDGAKIFAGHRDGTLRAYPITTDEPPQVMQVHNHGFDGLCSNLSGDFGVSIDDAGKLHVWNAQAMKLYGKLTNGPGNRNDYSESRAVVLLDNEERFFATLCVLRSGEQGVSYLQFRKLRGSKIP